ncbi:MAG: hypothetical protein HYZ68_05660 [Chloroflexi bacterium]|nr:hypothetical protein [Chloroflexota bacterium]
MRIAKGKLYAILTGDVVGSSKLKGKARVTLVRAMKETSTELRENFGGLVPFDVDIFRGDSWQLVVTDPAQSLRIGLFFRASVRARMRSKKVDTRVAIGIGTMDFLPGKNVSSGDGEAFRRSGTALESMSRTRRMALDCPVAISSGHAQAFDIVMRFVDVLARGWTEKQAQAVTGALREWTQEKIAKMWPGKEITQQAVAQHLDRAGWNAVENGLQFFERSVRALT